jgi:hypothetical protein
MKMGRERGILRWDAHSALLTQRLERAEHQLAALGVPAGGRDRERVARLTQEIEQLRGQLRALGPSPRAKMG